MLPSSVSVIIPGPSSGWEVWTPGPSGMVLAGEFAEPAAAADSVKAGVIALPARWCRTVSFPVPTADPKLLRPLAWAQLEKRGLTTGTQETTAFSWHLIPSPAGGHMLAVQVLTPAALQALAGVKALGVFPAARLTPLTAGTVVIRQEGGRAVLHAGLNGQPVHVQILTGNPENVRKTAAEISLTLLTLRQQQWLPESPVIEWQGELPAADARTLEDVTGVPVEVRPRPVPDAASLRRVLDPALQPPAVRAAGKARSRHLLRAVAAVAVIAAGLLWWQRQQSALSALEAEATRLESAVSAAAGAAGEARAGTERMRAIQERWQGLRMALEPKRYPLISLDHLSRCLGESTVVLYRFEARGPDLSVSGTAQSAMEAYSYYTTVSQDAALKICAWSMAEPSIDERGSARFEIKGKMR